MVPKFEPLMMVAVREAGEKLNELIQVIVLESEVLAKDTSLGENARRRASAIAQCARRAVAVSRTFFGFGDYGRVPQVPDEPEPPY